MKAQWRRRIALLILLTLVIAAATASDNALPKLENIQVSPYRYGNDDPARANQLLRTRQIKFTIQLDTKTEAKSADSDELFKQLRAFQDFSTVTLKSSTGRVWKLGQNGFQFPYGGVGSGFDRAIGHGNVYGNVVLPSLAAADDLTLHLETAIKKDFSPLRIDVVVRPGWEVRRPQRLTLLTTRMVRLVKPDPRVGALAIAISFRYAGTKPIWAIDQTLRAGLYREHWAPFKLRSAPKEYDALIVGQRYWLENERGELLEDHYPMHQQAAIYARYPSRLPNGDIQMLFPLNAAYIRTEQRRLADYNRRLSSFKRVYFYTEIGVENDGVLPIRFEIPKTTLEAEIKSQVRLRWPAETL